MRRLASFVAFLGLLACSDANGQPKYAQKTSASATTQSSAKMLAPLASGWLVDKSKSTLSFSGTQSGENFTGTFSGFDAVINFDPADLVNAKVVVTIDINSVDADDAERTGALPGKEWFYVKKFPTAKFETVSFEHLAKNDNGDKYKAKGNLTIRGISREITLPFTLEITEARAVMDAKLTLNRTQYKIGTGMWASEEWAGHNIAVNIHIEAERDK